MRGIKDKLTAGIVVVVGMALIRTNADPQLWQIAFLSIGLYEAINLFAQAAQTLKKDRTEKRIRKVNAEINHRNGRNLEEFRVGWPMREVSR